MLAFLLSSGMFLFSWLAKAHVHGTLLLRIVSLCKKLRRNSLLFYIMWLNSKVIREQKRNPCNYEKYLVINLQLMRHKTQIYNVFFAPFFKEKIILLVISMSSGDVSKISLPHYRILSLPEKLICFSIFGRFSLLVKAGSHCY